MSARERKLSANEAAFRAFNEGVRAVEERLGGADAAEFVCECGDASCEERIRVPLDEYATVRSDPVRFLIKKGHEIPEVERIVNENAVYAVIEKRPGGPAEVARRAAG